MENNFKNLYNKYLDIKKLGFVPSERKGSTGVGYTFESLLDKPEESFPIPDFDDIEVKTLRKNGRKEIHLFSIVPDGEFLFPMQRAVDLLGYPSKDLKEYKVLNKDFNAIDWTSIGYYRNAKLVVNRKEQKIYLIGIDYLLNPIELDISWSFKMLEDRLNLKLRNLAIVKAQSKKRIGKEFFYYDDIKFYKLKDFNTFISLIENGVINIAFRIDIIKNGEKKGKMKSRGTVFTINEKDIEKLFDRVSIKEDLEPRDKKNNYY